MASDATRGGRASGVGWDVGRTESRARAHRTAAHRSVTALVGRVGGWWSRVWCGYTPAARHGRNGTAGEERLSFAPRRRVDEGAPHRAARVFGDGGGGGGLREVVDVAVAGAGEANT